MRTKDSYVKNSMTAEGVNARCMTNFAIRWIHNKIHMICVFLSDIAQPRDANMKITNILTENVSFKGIYTYDLYIIIIVRINRGIANLCHKGSIFNCTEAELSCASKDRKDIRYKHRIIQIIRTQENKTLSFSCLSCCLSVWSL